jgi:Resolvase, N terminal domain
MKAVIYVRTATRQQTQHGNSIPAQIDACRKYAEENGFDVTEVFADPGYSGIRLDRPALSQMRGLIAREPISAVVVSDLTRLTRSVTHYLILESEFAKKGTHVHCVVRAASSSTASLAHVRGPEMMQRAYRRINLRNAVASNVVSAKGKDIMSKTKHVYKKCTKHAQGAKCPSPRAITPQEALILLEDATHYCQSAGLQVSAANGDNGTLGLFIPNAYCIPSNNNTRMAFRVGAMPPAANISTTEPLAQSDMQNISTHRVALEALLQG